MHEVHLNDWANGSSADVFFMYSFSQLVIFQAMHIKVRAKIFGIASGK